MDDEHDEHDERDDEVPDVPDRREMTYLEFEQYLAEPAPKGASGGSSWRILGQVVAVLLCLGGLAVVGYIVFVMIALSSWGSNK